ncbi:hypothetical protein DICSQDRAFT_148546 [Dichomitus squalens LYAD-421 SS1]|uniref:F-box domain-containing protein n=1 Tax=Dichomitus squalens (strain LYAD-421) TaxID=732165 RepID=R7SWG5_DICSQ|nr:uncharacterized protein DICSQDRAFT_148546 [Dichomitus squalens LYAD-421 SS1]EJF59317.1 hypothetical protein DICSQDRAFT_148546 [Dichomitus squalens LYAD-421 SS1]
MSSHCATFYLEGLICGHSSGPSPYAQPISSLLYVLSNLIACTFFTEDAEPLKTTFHTSTLRSCQLIANGVRSLSIHNLAFPTLLSFSRIISAFRKLEVVTCSRVEIKKVVDLHPGQLERLSRHLQLRKLSVEWGVDASAAALLLALAKPTLESLVLAPTIGTANPYAQLRATSEASSWTRVKCLVIKMTLQTKDVVFAVKLLKAFHPASLREVTVSFYSTSYGDYISILADEAHWELCSELERVLRRFPEHTMLFSADEPLAHTQSASIGTRSWTTPPQVNRAVHVNRPTEPCESCTTTILARNSKPTDD